MFTHFFLGREIDASRSEIKRLMLTGYLALICMTVAAMYTTFDISNQVYYALPSYACLFLMSVLSLLLLRRKKYKAAKLTLIVTINFVVFWSALIDPVETGVFLFFIPAGIGSFAILAFEDHKSGILLTA